MKRKISLIVIGLALVLIPTFIMLSFYLSNRSIPVEIRQAEQVIMITPEEELIKAQVGLDNEELITRLCDMTLDAKSVEKLPQEADACKKYQVSFCTGDSTLVYQFYFGENPAYCYFVTENNAVWRIDGEKALWFLNSDYAASVYVYNQAPEVRFDGAVLNATDLDWEYRRLDGSYHKAGCCVKGQKVQAHDIGELKDDLVFSYSLAPDLVWMTAHDQNGALIYSGDGSGIADISVKQDTTLSISLTLEWKKDASGAAPYSGKAVYQLQAQVYPDAEFTVSDTVISAGQTFLLQGINVKDASKLQICISPEVDFDVKFTTKGQSVKALMTLGFSENYAVDSDYEITVTSEEWEREYSFTVTVKADKYGEFTDYVSKDVLDNTFTVALKNEFFDCMKEIMSQPSSYTYEGGIIEFGMPITRPDANRHYSYGSLVTIFKSGETYRAFDTMYGADSLSKPVSVANGRVIFVGETALTGKMVVIDHGQGVRSWYCNLKDITVEPGQSVGMGDEIGSCLGQGFHGSLGINMHVALTLENTALNLEWAIQNGIRL